MRKTLLILTLALFLIFLSGADLLHAQGRRTAGAIRVPSPRLITPTSEIVNLQGKKGILFKWSSHQIPSGGRKKYRFQLYEGYDMYEQNLIFKKELDPFTFQIFIKKDKFKHDTVYTWSIRQRAFFANWSKRSFYSFRVKK